MISYITPVNTEATPVEDETEAGMDVEDTESTEETETTEAE